MNLFPALNSGTTLANFIHLGKILFKNDKLHCNDNGTAMTSAAILTNYKGIPSKPGDLLGFKAYIMLNISAGNVGSRNTEFGDCLLRNLKKSCSSW